MIIHNSDTPVRAALNKRARSSNNIGKIFDTEFSIASFLLCMAYKLCALSLKVFIMFNKNLNMSNQSKLLTYNHYDPWI